MNSSGSESSASEEPHEAHPASPASAPKKRRLWTKQEDERLRLLVSYWGDQGGRRNNWDKIAANFENRTSKNCRKRWFHSLDPKLRRGKWSKHEDKILKDAYEQMGASWQRIAQLIPGRTDDQCSKRYNDVLNPAIVDRLRPWTEEEDAKLKELHAEMGPKWQQISTKLPGRTGLTIRNRWRKLMRPPKTSADQNQDHTGDLGPSASDQNNSNANSDNGNEASSRGPGEGAAAIDNPMPFDVPGSMQGAGFPAGADASWLHMAHPPHMNMGGMTANVNASMNGLNHVSGVSGFNHPNGLSSMNGLNNMNGVNNMNGMSNIGASSDPALGQGRFGTPIMSYLNQNMLIPGNRTQFTLTVENAPNNSPLKFLRESHQPISSAHLEQIMDFAAKNRQQIVVHQHIYQFGDDFNSGNNVTMSNQGSASNIPNSSHMPNVSNISNLGNHFPRGNANVVTTSTIVQPNSFPEPAPMMRMVQPPVQPPPTNQLAVHPAPDRLHAVDTSGSHLGSTSAPLRSTAIGGQHPRQQQQQQQPQRPPLHLAPDTPEMMPESMVSHRLEDPDLPETFRRQESLLPQPPPDEFLSRPLLFEDLHNDSKFDTDEIDFLAFNPS